MIVTKEYLLQQIAKDPVKTIGRALVAIFNNQVGEEASGNYTRLRNGVGFTKSDGRIGASGAKYYLKHKTLQEWQLKIWNSPNKKGELRILKYAKQLNEVAKKRMAKEINFATRYGVSRKILSEGAQQVIKSITQSNH